MKPRTALAVVAGLAGVMIAQSIVLTFSTQDSLKI
jgi:hypothetical protein